MKKFADFLAEGINQNERVIDIATRAIQAARHSQSFTSVALSLKQATSINGYFANKEFRGVKIEHIATKLDDKVSWHVYYMESETYHHMYVIVKLSPDHRESYVMVRDQDKFLIPGDLHEARKQPKISNQDMKLQSIYHNVLAAVKGKRSFHVEISSWQAEQLVDMFDYLYGAHDHGMGLGGEDFGWFVDTENENELLGIDVSVGRGKGARTSEVTVNYVKDVTIDERLIAEAKRIKIPQSAIDRVLDHFRYRSTKPIKYSGHSDQIFNQMIDAALHLEYYKKVVPEQVARAIQDDLENYHSVEHMATGGGDITYAMNVKGKTVLLNINIHDWSVEVSPQTDDSEN